MFVALTPRRRRSLTAHSVEWGATFCFYASEYFRRNYRGGPWKWEPIFDAIEYCEGPARLYARIERGLRFLKRPLLQSQVGDRQFLLTLICEGGIPDYVLRNDGARVTRFLRAVLAESERYSAVEITEFARRLAGAYLPTGLRNEVFLDLCSHLVGTIRHLRTTLRGTTNAIQQLDRSDPKWRERVPIALDDEAAQRLLEGLLANPEQHPERVERLALDTFLRTGEKPTLSRVLRPASEIGVAHVAALLGKDSAEVPNRLGVQLALGEGQRVALGTLVRRSGGGFDVRSLDSSATIEDASQSTPLVFTQGSRHVGITAVEGCDALGDEGLWVFVPVDDEGHRFVACGSARVPAEHAVVAVPEGEGVLSSEGELTDIGTLLRRRLVKVTGTLIWQADRKRQVVSTRAAKDPRRFRLQGLIRRYAFLGAEVFSGAPDVVIDEDGAERIVRRADVELRHAVLGSRWQPCTVPTFGAARLRVVEQDEVVFTTRLSIVPPDFAIAIEPSPQDGKGRVIVSSSHVSSVAVVRDPAFTVTQTTQRTSHIADFQVTNGLPLAVELCARFNSGGELRARVPFPAKLLAFARGDRVLARGTELSMRSLSGVFARYLSAGKLGDVAVEARVGGAAPEYVGRLDERSIGKELHLEVVRDRIDLLIASSTGADDSVQLTLAEQGGAYEGRAHLVLRRYDARFVPEQHDDCAFLQLEKTDGAPGGYENLRVEAVPLWSPLQASEVLTKQVDGRWVLPFHERAAGPWLITGWINQAMCVRPLCVTVRGETSIRIRSQLEQVVRAPFGRTEAFDELCRDISNSWDHDEWRGFDGYLDTLDRFPVYTFEAIRALVRHPRAALLALMRSGDRGELLRRWRRFEELPFSWTVIPLRDWMHAGLVLREAAVRRAEACTLEGIEGSDWTVARFSQDLLRSLTDANPAPFVVCLREAWWKVLGDFPEPGGPRMIDAMSVRGHRRLIAQTLAPLTQELIAVHAEERWPQVHLEDVESNASSDAVSFVREFWASELAGKNWRRDVFLAPVIAAAITVWSGEASAATIRAIRRVRTFDEAWFDSIHAFALAYFIGERVERNPMFLDDMVGA